MINAIPTNGKTDMEGRNMGDNNNENRDAEALFATKRRQQAEEEAEKARQEELERKKAEMEAEIKRLEKLEVDKRLEMREQQQQQQQPPLKKPGFMKKKPDAPKNVQEGGAAPEKKKIPKPLIIAAAIIGVLFIGCAVLGGGGGSKDTNSGSGGSGSNYEIKEDGSAFFEGHAYKVIDQYATFEEAYRVCHEAGGHLVTIGTEEEQKFLEKLIEQTGKRSSYWIGLVGYDDWKNFWIDYTELEYTNWMENEDALNGFYGMICGKLTDEAEAADSYKWFLYPYGEAPDYADTIGFIAEFEQ